MDAKYDAPYMEIIKINCGSHICEMSTATGGIQDYVVSTEEDW